MDLDPSSEVTFLRLRSNKHEILVAPGVGLSCAPCASYICACTCKVAYTALCEYTWGLICKGHMHPCALARVSKQKSWCFSGVAQLHSHALFINSIHHRVSAASNGVGAFFDTSAPLLFNGHSGAACMRRTRARALSCAHPLCQQLSLYAS